MVCLVAVLLLFITACSKDQKVAKQLDGTWKIDKIIPKIGSEITDSLPTLSFTKCKVKKTTCVGTFKSSDGNSAEFEWEIFEKGETFDFFTTTMPVDTLTLTINWAAVESIMYMLGEHDIVEHSKTNFVITRKDFGVIPDSLIFTIEMSKQ